MEDFDLNNKASDVSTLPNRPANEAEKAGLGDCQTHPNNKLFNSNFSTLVEAQDE